jgi:hypothetical protein
VRWLKTDWDFKLAFLVFGVLLLLGGCATTAAPETPAELMQDCPAPLVSTRTNGELAEGILALRAALRQCNDDKAALRFHYDVPDYRDRP